MAYKVKRNNATGAFECHFEHDGHKYFARVRYVPMSSGAELVITSEDEIDVMYGKWDVPVSEEGLISCIEEFVRMKEAV
jgi:hypothetical protein